MNVRLALTILKANFYAWAWFPYGLRRPAAKRAYLKSKTEALIRHDRVLTADPRAKETLTVHRNH